MPTYRITDPATGRTLRIEGPSPPSEAIVRQMFAQAAKASPPEMPAGAALDLPQSGPGQATAPVPTRSGVSRAAETLPMVGGTVGGIVGGIPGAAIGGAAGEGLKQVVQQAGQIPGAVVDVARNLFTQPKATLQGFAEGATGGAKDAAIQGGVQGGLEAAGGVAMKGLQTAGKAVYRGYLKPSLAGHAIKDAEQIVKTALDEGISITARGRDKATKLIGELNAQVQSILSSRQHISKTLHGDIDLHKIADEVRDFARKKYNQPGRDPADFKAAMQVADNIDMHPSLQKTVAQATDPIPVALAEANATKGRLYASAGDRAFGQEAKSAATEAEKHGARGLKEAIEYRAPKAGPLNERESKLIDAAKSIAHAVQREANQYVLAGAKSLATAGAVGGTYYGATKDPYSAAGWALAARAALSPAVATRLAIITYRLGKTGGIAPASAARVAMAALAASEDDE